jgi:hypothetical protein
MLLQDLPAKTFHHLLKSVTWTEVDALPIKNPLRRFVSRIAKPGRVGRECPTKLPHRPGKDDRSIFLDSDGCRTAPWSVMEPIAYDAR